MRELKNVIRRGRTAGLTPAHYAISDVPAGIFDADVFAHFSLSLSLCVLIRWFGEYVLYLLWLWLCLPTGQSRPGVGRFEKKSNKRILECANVHREGSCSRDTVGRYDERSVVVWNRPGGCF